MMLISRTRTVQGSVVLAALLLLNACGGGGGATVSEEQQIVATNTQFRSQVASILTRAASEFGVEIEPDNFASIIQRDSENVRFSVNASIRGVEQLTIDDLRRGADILFTFLHFSDGRSGFFVTRIREENGEWIAELRTLEGSTTIRDVDVGTGNPGNPLPIQGTFLSLKFWTSWYQACRDIHWTSPSSPFTFQGCGQPDFTERTTQGNYESQLGDIAIRTLDTMEQALRSRSRNASREVMCISRDDTLVVAQMHSGVSSWTLERLAQQSPMTCYYHTGNSSRIVPVQITNDNGVWSTPNLPVARLVIKEPSRPRPPRPHLAQNERNAVIEFPVADNDVEIEFPVQ